MVKPDVPLTRGEEETIRLVWASTFGCINWYVMRTTSHRYHGKQLLDYARRCAVKAADESVAAYEEHLRESHEKYREETL